MSMCVWGAEDDNRFYATAGKCTHGAADPADGRWWKGTWLMECPKHNGCFDFKTGMAMRLPVRSKLRFYSLIRQ